MTNCSRRQFLKTGVAAGVLAGTGSLPLRAAGGTATDWVALGKSNVKVTRLALPACGFVAKPRTSRL